LSVVDRLNAAFAEWENSLSPDEVESLHYYQDDKAAFHQSRNFERINEFFRDPDSAARTLSDSDYMVIEEVSARLDAAISRGWMPEDVTVYRGMKSYAKLFGFRPESQLSGFDFHERAYTSATVYAHRADQFLDEEEGFMLTFQVPWKHHAAWLPRIGLPKMAGQRELLLPRNLNFRVVTTAVRAGILWVEAEIISPTGKGLLIPS
jgi:hypothetical protein